MPSVHGDPHVLAAGHAGQGTGGLAAPRSALPRWSLTVGQFQLRIQMWSARNDVVRRSPTSNGQNQTNRTAKIAR